MRGTGAPLRTRWLGTVRYSDAWALQQGLHADRAGSGDDHLLLLEHPPTYTLGRNADGSNVLVDPSDVGAELVAVDRGGDVTFHGPGQLVAYPILTLPPKGAGGAADVRAGLPDTPGYVGLLEQVLIDTLAEVGLSDVGRHDGYPGVWVAPNTEAARKIAAIGVRIEHGRSLHGIALNVTTDLDWFGHIVPCGIHDFGVTSLSAEGIDVPMRTVVETFTARFVHRWQPSTVRSNDVVWRHSDADLAPFSRGAGPGEVTGGGNAARRPRSEESTSVRLLGRLAQAGVTGGIDLTAPKPDWMRARVHHDATVMSLKHTIRDLDLVTVCEEAGCPNLSECWSEGTATFMVCGERCTRKCGFCLVDTRKPEALDEGEPDRVAEAVDRMGLDFAVVTMVARDDLDDGGAAHVARTIDAIRHRRPTTQVEVLISDCKGEPASLARIFDARPDVLNHNIETVARLQRAVRPSASYARSLSVLSRAAADGLTVKSGLVLGMGETEDEIVETLADLAAVGVSIVTIGQYLRPTSNHLPVARWWEPSDYDRFKVIGESMGITHVESSPFTRSSYHARSSADAAAAPIAAPVAVELTPSRAATAPTSTSQEA